MRMSWFNCKKLRGRIKPPPDKSITHRALILGSISEDGIKIKNPLISGDTLSTIKCLLALGKNIKIEEKEIFIEPGDFKEPKEVLYCGNSGTTTRLLAGLLSGKSFFSVLDGDSSLKNRPMGRVVEPLRKMGAQIYGRGFNSYLPIAIKGGNLKGIEFDLNIPSAQVKSAIIISALFAEGESIIKENFKSRDHTERMLSWLGVDLEINGEKIKVYGSRKVRGGEMDVPADISSASFFIGGAVILKGSHIIVENVGLNPTRTGLLKVLQNMGANLKILNLKNQCNEEVGDVEVKYSQLKSVEIKAEMIPSLIDEIPILALVATQADGITKIEGAKELRYKESDRVRSICDSLRKMGAKIEEMDDGMIIEGPSPLKGCYLKSYEDHRIAMTLSIASLLAKGETSIDGFEWIEISYPNFLNDLLSLCTC
ncbi:MAG: 3-phosphoshikimate 1-carboxyvinyltransferase [Candidatus Aminicenantia bacterium]